MPNNIQQNRSHRIPVNVPLERRGLSTGMTQRAQEGQKERAVVANSRGFPQAGGGCVRLQFPRGGHPSTRLISHRGEESTSSLRPEGDSPVDLDGCVCDRLHLHHSKRTPASYNSSKGVSESGRTVRFFKGGGLISTPNQPPITLAPSNTHINMVNSYQKILTEHYSNSIKLISRSAKNVTKV